MLKFVSQELKIKSKLAKIGLEMQDLKKVESLELEKFLKRWVFRAEMWPEKGDLDGGTPLYDLPM